MTMTTDFKITALKVIDAPASPATGNRLLALFDVTAGGVSIQPCGLVEGSDGITRVKGPRGKTRKGDAIAVTITDAALLRAVTRKAVSLYAACTGREVADE